MATTTASTSYYTVVELLMRYDVDPKTAKYVAINELRSWPLAKLSEIFGQIKRSERGFCPLKSPAEFRKTLERIDEDAQPKTTARSKVKGNEDRDLDFGNYFRSVWPSVFAEPDPWLSPSRKMMWDAVDQNAALCVNINGEFGLRQDGYLAISHTWLEGLQRDEEHDGVLKSKINLIFFALRRQAIATEWIWIDVLAVPLSAAAKTAAADDLLKIDIINTLADVYQNADGIVILDAMTWQLQPKTPFDVPVVLVCGAWASRVWTYQEIKLAKKAYILTSGPRGELPPIWEDIVGMLAFSQEQLHDLFHRLWRFFAVLHDKQKDPITRHSIRDLIGRCQYRATGNDIDYARAFFPVLGLKWRRGMTREEGIQQIYHSQHREATRTMFYYGAPRLGIRPGWAPSTLVGLEGEESDGLEMEERGIRGDLAVVQITSIASKFKRLGKLALNCIVGDVQIQCMVHESERKDMIDDIEAAIDREALYLLRPLHHLSTAPSQEFARVGLFAVKPRMQGSSAFECAVLCAVLLTSPAQVNSPVQVPFRSQNILIRHGSFTNFDLYNRIQYLWHAQLENNQNSRLEDKADTRSLHSAVRNDDLETVKRLLSENADVNGFDHTGLAPLHIAAIRGNGTILQYLLGNTHVNVNLISKPPHRDMPLHLAARYNQPTSIQILVKHGVGVDVRNQIHYTPLMTAASCNSLEAIEILLTLGADPNVNGSGSLRETPLKLACTRGGDHGRRGKLIAKLLDAGSDPNGILQNLPDHVPRIDNFMSWNNAALDLHEEGVEYATTDISTPTPTPMPRSTPLPELASDVSPVPESHSVAVPKPAAETTTLEQPDFKSKTPLFRRHATWNNPSAHGPPMDASNPCVWPALAVAISSSLHIETISLLLERGASPDSPPSCSGYAGFNPLALAIHARQVDVVELLVLKHGARCDVDFEDRVNLLHYAAACRDFHVVQMLLEQLDRDSNDTGKKGELVRMRTTCADAVTPLDVAERCGVSVVTKLLKEAAGVGADAGGEGAAAV